MHTKFQYKGLSILLRYLKYSAFDSKKLLGALKVQQRDCVDLLATLLVWLTGHNFSFLVIIHGMNSLFCSVVK